MLFRSFVSVGGPASIREGVTREGVIPIVKRYVSEDEMDAYLDANYTEDAVLITMRPKVWNSVDYNKESIEPASADAATGERE